MILLPVGSYGTRNMGVIIMEQNNGWYCVSYEYDLLSEFSYGGSVPSPVDFSPKWTPISQPRRYIQSHGTLIGEK
jgi:hypothetical protein